MNYLGNPSLVMRYATTDDAANKYKSSIERVELPAVISSNPVPSNSVTFDLDKGIKIGIIMVLASLALYLLSKRKR